MAVTVTHLVQHIVQTTHVLYTMEPVYHVYLAGEMQFVQRVRFFFVFVFVFFLDKLMINNPSFSLFTTCLKYINIVNANFPLTACSHGWYGQDCEQRCSGYCKRYTSCNHMTRQCEKGCEVGWSGSFCNKGNCFFVYIKWFG